VAVGVSGRTDWGEWHRGYDDPRSDLSRRRRSVQSQVEAWLDSREDPALRVVSACSGDGRDLLEVLAGRHDGARVSARLLETDERLAASAESFAAEHRLAVDVRRADAGRTDSYAGAVPADLVMMCGVFGNVTDEDLHGTVRLLPRLCAEGATVVWTRGHFETDLAPTIAGWFEDAGFERVALDMPKDTTYRVGAHRLVGAAEPLEPDRTFFTFVR
jgi:hypothetical protein